MGIEKKKNFDDTALYKRFIAGNMSNYLTYDDVNNLLSKLSYEFPELISL